jgi:gas vesicle structural protein
MTTAIQPARVAGPPSSSSLADVVDTILDKGLVIDAYVRVSVVGIELLTVDARIVVASVDTYLRFAEAVNRLNISEEDPKADLPGLVGDVTNKVTEGVAKHKTKGALESAGEKLSEMLTEAQPQRQKSSQPRRRRSR